MEKNKAPYKGIGSARSGASSYYLREGLCDKVIFE